MTIGGISGGSSGLGSFHSTLQAFKSGKLNISKADLTTAADASGGESIAAQFLSNFDTVDTNGDGALSASEAQVYARSGALKLPQGFGSHGQGDGSGPPAMTIDQLKAFQSKIASADSAGADGLNKIISNFSSVDTNGDGKASFDEVKSYADANGIQLPKPPQHDHGKKRDQDLDDIIAATNTTSSTASTDTTSSADQSSGVSTNFIQMILGRYAKNYSPDPSQLLGGVSKSKNFSHSLHAYLQARDALRVDCGEEHQLYATRWSGVLS
jgi:Ca2+-binding EF-hand superfamily protein